MTYKDDGNPCNYYFVVAEDEMDNSLAMIAITPIVYFNKEKCLSDWHINVQNPYLGQVMESTFLVDEWPDGVSDFKSMHKYMLKQGYQYDHGFAAFMAGCANNCFIPACSTVAKPKTAKLSSAFFKDYIQNVMSSDPHYGEIFEAYEEEAETASLKNANDWKRSMKKRATIKTIVDDANDPLTYDDIYGCASSALGNFYYDSHFKKKFDVESWEHTGKVFDAAYLSNENNKVVVREYWCIGNEDQDTAISFITNADDTEIVAICTHID